MYSIIGVVLCGSWCIGCDVCSFVCITNTTIYMLEHFVYMYDSLHVYACVVRCVVGCLQCVFRD